MTLERNNAARARHSTTDAANHLEPQFAAMLRRHLQRQPAPSTDCTGPTCCTGFDADLASAYLERALSVGLQAQYETHLAACPACRRHLLAFARLNEQLAPLAQPFTVTQANPFQPSVAAVGMTGQAWWHLTEVRDRLAAWFALPTWNLGLAATGMAAMLLVGMFSWQALRSNQASPASLSSNDLNGEIARANAADAAPSNVPTTPFEAAQNERTSVAPLATSETKATALPAAMQALATTASGGADASVPNAAASTAAAMTRQRGVPQPAVPVLEAFTLPMQPAEVRVLPSSISVPGSLVASSLTGEAPRTLPTHVEVREIGPMRKSAQMPMLSSESFTALTGQPGNAQLVRLSQPQFDQPMQGFGRLSGEVQPPIGEIVAPQFKRLTKREQDALALKERELAKAEAAKTNSNPRNILGSLRRGAVTSFLPGKLGEDLRTKEAEKNDAGVTAAKPLMQQIYGRTFYFERGFWIDDEYRSDTVLPIIRLVRGNQRYQQILIENPGLEQFFKLGQVIVIWKGKVYEVRKS